MFEEMTIFEKATFYFAEGFNDSENRMIAEEFLENVGLESFDDEDSEDGTDTLTIDQYNIDSEVDIEAELEQLVPYVKKNSAVYVRHFDPGDISSDCRIRYRFDGEKWEVAVKDLLFEDEK